ncbi:DUF6090 family protein [Maribacter arcticus]|uniref:DUF6090 family protein n=1 Tax=Maribacter arcticus TaxID=561365 RepID=UPI0030033956
MIKFFRKIRQQLLIENKTGKYLKYAIGEIVLVVIGILIALQVNSWNEYRINSHLELQYLKRLERDMQESIRLTSIYKDFQVQATIEILAVIDIIKKCNLTEKDYHAFANGFFKVGKSSPPILIDGTIQELQSTGKLTIIRNVNLRDKMTKMMSEYQSKIVLMPYANSRMGNAVNYVDELVSFSYINQPVMMQDISFEEMNFNFETLCENEKLINALFTIRQHTLDIIEWEEVVIKEFNSFLKSITEEIRNLET